MVLEWWRFYGWQRPGRGTESELPPCLYLPALLPRSTSSLLQTENGAAVTAQKRTHATVAIARMQRTLTPPVSADVLSSLALRTPRSDVNQPEIRVDVFLTQ